LAGAVGKQATLPGLHAFKKASRSALEEEI
jgi:hypothetical protein